MGTEKYEKLYREVCECLDYVIDSKDDFKGFVVERRSDELCITAPSVPLHACFMRISRERNTPCLFKDRSSMLKVLGVLQLFSDEPYGNASGWFIERQRSRTPGRGLAVYLFRKKV